jgi:hypothetical protein
VSICLCVARAANEASKLPIGGDGVFLRRADRRGILSR